MKMTNVFLYVTIKLKEEDKVTRVEGGIFVNRWKVICVLILAVILIAISACTANDVHEEQYESNVIRIYDVEPLEAYGMQCDQHYLRVGLLPHIEEATSETAPFVNQIKAIEEETGADIEYIVVSSWEELRKEQEYFKDVNVTEMILFNNTYDESIIKEVASGNYANMDVALQEYGFYDEEKYNQVVLEAGVFETGQMLIPILYNVPGMIHGDGQEYEYKEWKELAYGHAETAKINFEDFISMLNEVMVTVDVEEMEIPFLSGNDYEGEIDLFLMAAGEKWEDYQEQEELFYILYEYLKIYEETQVESKNGGKTNQQLYIDHIKEKQFTRTMDEFSNPARVTRRIADDLQIKTSDSEIQVSDVTEMFLYEMIRSLFERTNYFVESTGADDIAFHSVYGLLAYRNYYVVKNFTASNSMADFEVYTSGNMEYWPIGVYGSKYEYAAQPICYAAVVEGGNTRLAAKVLQSMMNQETDIKFGISLSKQTMEKQVNTWLTTYDLIGKVREIRFEKRDIDAEAKAYGYIVENYWGQYLTNKKSFYFEDKEIYAGQIDEQIRNITVAEIPDRELLSIWQETLTETLGNGLSAEEGFKLLCERMDAWYK